MNAHVAKELLNELSASLEALETQNAALLELLKEKGIVTEEELAPYMEQAGNASNVRWLAAKVRLERVFEAAVKEEEKARQAVNESKPKNEAQPDKTDRRPEEASKTAEPKPVAKENTQKEADEKPSEQREEGAA